VLSGRGLCDELITHPEESYRLWYVVVCDLETSRMRRSWPALGRSATAKNKLRNNKLYAAFSNSNLSFTIRYILILCWIYHSSGGIVIRDFGFDFQEVSIRFNFSYSILASSWPTHYSAQWVNEVFFSVRQIRSEWRCNVISISYRN
jgi:hypothetical protein